MDSLVSMLCGSVCELFQVLIVSVWLSRTIGAYGMALHKDYVPIVTSRVNSQSLVTTPKTGWVCCYLVNY